MLNIAASRILCVSIFHAIHGQPFRQTVSSNLIITITRHANFRYERGDKVSGKLYHGFEIRNPRNAEKRDGSARWITRADSRIQSSRELLGVAKGGGEEDALAGMAFHGWHRGNIYYPAPYCWLTYASNTPRLAQMQTRQAGSYLSRRRNAV